MVTPDERPFCRDCDGYISGGTGADEPVCCCDSDDESDDEPTSTEILCEENGIPTPEEYELLPPDEQKLMYLKAKTELEAEKAKTKKLKLKLKPKKKVIKLKLKKKSVK